jgi:general secretion pathway protein G
MSRVLSYWWVAFVGSLVVLVAPAFFSTIDHPPINRATQDLRGIQTALELFRGQRGSYPSQEEGLTALVGTQMVRLPKDPWGSDYAYRSISPTNAHVYSIGLNRRDDDGAGDDILADRNRPFCDDYDNACVERVVGAGLLALAAASLAVGIVRGWRRLRSARA